MGPASRRWTGVCWVAGDGRPASQAWSNVGWCQLGLVVADPLVADEPEVPAALEPTPTALFPAAPAQPVNFPGRKSNF